MAFIATSEVLVDWLERAGVPVKDREVTRVIIDAKAGDTVKIYINQQASVALFDVVPPTMDGAEIIRNA